MNCAFSLRGRPWCTAILITEGDDLVGVIYSFKQMNNNIFTYPVCVSTVMWCEWRNMKGRGDSSWGRRELRLKLKLHDLFILIPLLYIYTRGCVLLFTLNWASMNPQDWVIMQCDAKTTDNNFNTLEYSVNETQQRFGWLFKNKLLQILTKQPSQFHILINRYQN